MPPPAGGIGLGLPPGAGVAEPEPVVPSSWVRSMHWDEDIPAGLADSHCVMVWKLHCVPLGPLRQNCPVPVWATDGVLMSASVTADAAISVRMIHLSC